MTPKTLGDVRTLLRHLPGISASGTVRATSPPELEQAAAGADTVAVALRIGVDVGGRRVLVQR